MRPIGALFIEPIIKVSEKFPVPRLLPRPQAARYTSSYSDVSVIIRGLSLALYKIPCARIKSKYKNY